MMAGWNKLEASFELIQLEMEAGSRGKTWYWNTVSDFLGQMQNSLNDTN
jgi:hypothetical protein